MTARTTERRRTAAFLPPALLLLCSALAVAQELPIQPQVLSAPSGGSVTTPMYPEQGFLSPSRYTSACFGFSIDLPAGAPLRRLHARILPSGDHYLLALEFGGADRTTRIVIRARREKGDGAEQAARSLAAELRKQEMGWAGAERHKLGPMPAWRAENGGSSYVFEHAVLWYLDLPGCTPGSRYLLEIATDSTDPAFDAKLRKAVESVQFFSAKVGIADDLPAAAREEAGADAAPYTGPALPTDLVDQTIAAGPARKIDAGEWKDNTYSNAAVGVTFDVPAGFRVLPVGEGARVLALAQELSPSGRMPDRRHDLWLACSRTLVVVEDVEHPLANDVFPAAVLTVTRRDCIPDLRPPEDLNDHEAVESFTDLLVRSTEMIGLQKGLAGVRVGRKIIALEGTVPFRREGEALARRLSMRLTASSVGNDYLLTFFAVAENDAELRKLEAAVREIDATSR